MAVTYDQVLASSAPRIGIFEQRMRLHRQANEKRRHDGGVMMQPIYPARLRNKIC